MNLYIFINDSLRNSLLNSLYNVYNYYKIYFFQKTLESTNPENQIKEINFKKRLIKFNKFWFNYLVNSSYSLVSKILKNLIYNLNKVKEIDGCL